MNLKRMDRAVARGFRAMAASGSASSSRLPTLTSYHPQGAKGDMLKNQSSLPKLPVPPLQQSLHKYLKAVQPLVNEEQFRKTKMAVEEFGRSNGVGEKLQKALEERAATHDNWLAEWWLNGAYLAFRESVVINSSPYSFYPYPAINKDTFLHYAMRIILASAKFRLLSVSEKLPPEVIKGTPLCMSQYHDFLSCCRIPGREVDTLKRSPIEHSCHIIVAHNGHFFSLDVFSPLSDGGYGLVPAGHIEEQLQMIVDSSPVRAEHPVGVLTSEHRDTWYNARQRLLADSVNRSSLDRIETAQFMLCLDSPHPRVDANTPPTEVRSIMGCNCLHGNGTAFNTCNRWFDHSIQSLMFPEGYGGSNMEHSSSDGTSAIQVTFYSLNNLESHELVTYKSPVPVERLTPAQQIKWNISPASATDIETAKANIDKAIADCDVEVFAFEEFGKEVVKSLRVSPDSFIQIAIQLAYYKIYGHLDANYESGATRMFLYGRTDTIRATSLETLAFCQAVCNHQSATTNNEKMTKLLAAIETHRQCATEAVSGRTFDRHLFGLSKLAGQSGVPMPSIFTDEAFAKIFHIYLSTSQISTNHTVYCGFGAVVPDGYGVCYIPKPEKLLFTLSSFNHSSKTDNEKFIAKLFDSLRLMQSILKSRSSPKL